MKSSALKLVLLTTLLTLPLWAQQFPADIDAEPSGIWKPVKTVPTGVSDIITFRYLPGGKAMLVSTDIGELALVNLTSSATTWSTRPFPESKNQIHIADISPDGRTFLTWTGLGALEAHYTLNVHSMKDGAIVRQLSEETAFWQPRANIDLRKPDPAEVQQRHEMGLGDNWMLVPRAARYVNGGKQVLVTWVSSMTGPDMFDRHFMLYDAASWRRAWEYTIVADRENFDDDQPAGFQIGLPQPPIAARQPGNLFFYGTPHARIHILDLDTVTASAAAEKVEDKVPGPVFANPRHPKSSYGDMAQAICDLAVDNGRNLLYAAAGTNSEQFVYVYDMTSGAEMFRSAEMPVEYLRLSTDGNLLVTMSRQIGNTRLFNLAAGTMEFRSNTSIELNPSAPEFAELSGDDLVIYRRK